MKRVFLLVAVMALALAVASGVALAATVNCTGGDCEGTNKADTMNGTSGADYMRGKGGDDLMRGKDDDEMEGDQGADTIKAGDGDDSYLWGGFDNDADKVYGEDGDDHIYAGYGKTKAVDQAFGGPGNDTIDAAERSSIGFKVAKSIIDCGPGDDTVFFDQGLDKVNRDNCENLIAYSANGSTTAASADLSDKQAPPVE